MWVVVEPEPGRLDAAVPDGVADGRKSQNRRPRPAPQHASVRFAWRADRAPGSRAGNGSCNSRKGRAVSMTSATLRVAAAIAHALPADELRVARRWSCSNPEFRRDELRRVVAVLRPHPGAARSTMLPSSSPWHSRAIAAASRRQSSVIQTHICSSLGRARRTWTRTRAGRGMRVRSRFAALDMACSCMSSRCESLRRARSNDEAPRPAAE